MLTALVIAASQLPSWVCCQRLSPALMLVVSVEPMSVQKGVEDGADSEAGSENVHKGQLSLHGCWVGFLLLCCLGCVDYCV